MKPLRHPRKNRFRSRSLGAAATTAAATGLADTASATIIFDWTSSYSPNETFSFVGTAASELELSSTGMMGDLDLSLEGPTGMGPDSTVELSIFTVGMGMNAVDYLTLYSYGDTVDASLVFTSEGFLVEDGVTNPVWAPGTTGYAGFVFDNGTGPLYGWLQLEFDASGLDFTVTQWAYDDTGIPITVGMVPEPGTGLLLGLGLAGLAAGLKRRRRNHLSKTV